MSEEHLPVFATADADALLSSGLITLPGSEGTRRIHKRRTNRSSDEEHHHLPLQPASPDNHDIFDVVPDHMVSKATLEYLGYNAAKAAQIWHDWSNWPDTDPIRRETDSDKDNASFYVTFIEFATGRLNASRPYDTYEQDDGAWLRCLNQCGINNELQTAIMDPVFRQVRFNQTCLFWINDTMEIRYRGLEEVQRASRERAQANARARSRPQGSATTTNRSISATISIGPGMASDTALSQAALAASRIQGSMTLFKGVDRALVARIFNEDGSILTTQPLFSTRPTDFSRSGGSIYFAVDRDVAITYAAWIKRRADISAVALLQVTIANSVIEGLSTQELQKVYWPSSEWRRLVFLCRKGLRLTSDLCKYRQATLVIGTIAERANGFYHQLNSPDEIDEAMVLKNQDGRPAVQYVFQGETGTDFFEEKVAASLKGYPMSSADFQKWMEEGHASRE